MQLSLIIALIAVVLIYIFIILKAVKRKNMRIGYLIFWMLTGLCFIIALLIPNLVDNISNLLGFGMPINMIFSLAIFVILYLIFDLTIQISKGERTNTQLVQEISILKERVKELENRDMEK